MDLVIWSFGDLAILDNRAQDYFFRSKRSIQQQKIVWLIQSILRYKNFDW